MITDLLGASAELMLLRQRGHALPLLARRRPGREWIDDAESDLGLALIELAAYAGDVLAAYQEQIAAEARLTTRRRSAAVLGVLIVLIVWRHRKATPWAAPHAG
jgi:hypothetical protein